jgi:hypothetical protein
MDLSSDSDLTNKLRDLALRLIDQHAAQTLVPPLGASSGYWFGGGNLLQEDSGSLLLCGRYRNAGDARTGTGDGTRGLEFAIFRGSSGFSGSFTKIRSFSKSDLSTDEAPVISIEGGCLLPGPEGHGWELFISTEKAAPYPKGLIHFQKPGTGVWSIDRISSSETNPATLDAETLSSVFSSPDGGSLHVKDPVAFHSTNGDTELLFCSHPFSWSSSNTGLARRLEGEDSFELLSTSILERGASWDVACVRVTERLVLPRIGVLSELPSVSLYFYDGAECLRPLQQNTRAAKRPRGYSCEELGGLAWGFNDEFPKMKRLSVNFPLFLSPHAPGCSRYVSSIALADGSLAAAWQQGAADGSQPLVGHSLSAHEVGRILA